MRLNIVRTFVFASLVMSVAGVVSAQSGPCSDARAAGDWGYTATGTLIFPTGAVPFAIVGKFTSDAAGNFSGAQDSNAGGRVAKDAIEGTISLDPDCTGTATVRIYDQSGTLLRTAYYSLAYVDQAKEFRGIITSLVLADGTHLPNVVTLEAKKQ